MAYGDPQLLHLDSMLTEVSVGYQNDEFVADILAPDISVSKQSDKYYVFDRSTWGRVTDDIRQPGSRANELPPMSLSRDSYFVEEHALEDVVPIEEVKNADDPLTPLVDATERVTNTLLLNREKALVDMFTTTGNYATGHVATLSGTSQWNDYTNSNPISDVKAGRSKIHSVFFNDPNTAICQYEVAVKLEDHPQFIDRIKYSQRGVTTDQLIAELMGIMSFRRAGAGYVSSAWGQPETAVFMWPKVFLLAYVPPRPARKTPAFAYTFRWNFETGTSIVSERWYDVERKADIVRVSSRYTTKFISIDDSGKAIAGYLITNAIA